MRIKSIGSNRTEIILDKLEILISYETPVACITHNTRRIAYKTNKFHSVTTSRHINQWLSDKGYNPENVDLSDQEFFNELLEY